MCIAIYKPMGTAFPAKETLETCFNNNHDGAGFMVATGDKVTIHKGFMDFRSFWSALTATRDRYGDDKAYVMHFRISTQGGIRPDGCHPFPLSGDMDDMRLLDAECEIGIAHNGIISLCSSGYKSGKVDYSDTMAFITEYLSLIINGRKYYKDKKKIELIEKLCGSRLAILDKRGHCELIGSGWSKDSGIWYSNKSYEAPKTIKTTFTFPTLYDWAKKEPLTDDDDFENDFEDDAYDDCINALYEEYDYYLSDYGIYEFPRDVCPVDEIGDASFCQYCARFAECYGEKERTPYVEKIRLDVERNRLDNYKGDYRDGYCTHIE